MESTVAGKRRIETQGGTLRCPGLRALEITSIPRVVGRGAGCDLVLSDSKVSAVHMELVATDAGVRVRDLGSRNGTFLGEQRIVEAYLTSKATLVCGDTEVSFAPALPEEVPLSRAPFFGPLAGSSPKMRALFEQLRVLSKSNLSVLILGETGTGKELVAKAIHEASPKAKSPFVVVDCGAIPAALAESALFGHERGAFTGAIAKRISPFVEARGGTIFLDELGELPLETQPKLLRVLAEQRIKSVGSNTYADIDVRIVCATRRDIRKEVNLETFRSDLYFRIAQARIEIPPLRERTDDIPLLVEQLLKRLGAPQAFRRVTPESLDRAERHDWPGNVRELCNVVSLALAYDQGGPIDLGRHLSSAQVGSPGGVRSFEGHTFAEAKSELERVYFSALYAACHGNVSEIARKADVDRKTARECLKRHDIGQGS
jgi:DNA-binding NtrC family response regulator